LLQASSLLLNADSEEEVLSQTLDLASNLLFADAYGLWRESEVEHVWRVVAQRGLPEVYPRSVTINPPTFRKGVWMMEDVLNDPRAVFSRELYAAANIRSALLIPWMADTTKNGALIFYWSQPREFYQDDVDYAVALSNLSASTLYRIELAERRRIEERRAAFLAEAGSMLSSSLDYKSTLDRVARLAVAEIAEWCTVYLLQDGEIVTIAAAHANPAMDSFAEGYARKHPDVILPESGVGKVIATGEPEIIPHITEEMVYAAAEDAGHLRLLRQLDLSASMIVPLQSQGRILGAIRLLGTGDRYFGPEHVRLALDLGSRAAIAIENAQLHRDLLQQESELRRSDAATRMGSRGRDAECRVPDTKSPVRTP
jgi:GAF domain-containing protein